MKDSKRIDNKAKSRRIAAYALAGCMAVTAAPMTMPNMGAEVVEAATYNLEKLENATDVDLKIVNDIRYNTTFEDAAKRLFVEATQGGETGIWAAKASEVTILNAAGTEVIWDSKGSTSTPGSTKFGYGVEYKIKAKFARTMKLVNGDATYTGTIEENGTTPTTFNKIDANTIDAGVTTPGQALSVVFYPSTGMFLNESYDGGTNYKYVDSTGNPDPTKTGVYKNDDGWFLVKGGDTAGATTLPSLEKNANGTWYIGKDKKVDFTKTGIVNAPNIANNETYTGVPEGQYYVANGKVDYNKTGLVFDGGDYYKVVKGKVATDASKSDVMKISDGNWVYIDKTTGKSDMTYTGIAKNANGTWWIEEGVVDFTKEGPASAAGKTYYFSGGKVQKNLSGTVFYDGVAYFVENGVVTTADMDKRTLAKDMKTGVWYAINPDGSMALGYEGLVTNQYGTWYVNNGKVDFTKTGIVTDADDDVYTEYYVEKGKLQTGKNGVIIDSDRMGVCNVKAGKVAALDINKSVVKASNGRWYVLDENGWATDGSMTPQIAANSNGIWVTTTGNGVVDFDATGFHCVSEYESKITGLKEGDYVYFKDGKAQTNITGIVKVTRANNLPGAVGVRTTVYLKNGVVTNEFETSEPTVVKAADGKWYYCDEDGIDLTKEGVATNKYGTWYIKNGVVSFNYTGFYRDRVAEKEYYFVNSKLATDKTGLVINGASKKYVEKGIVTGLKSGNNVVKAADGSWYVVGTDGNHIKKLDVSGVATNINVATNKNGTWYISPGNGKVDFAKTGIVTVSASADDDIKPNDRLYFVKGKLQSDYTGVVKDSTGIYYVSKGKVTSNSKPELVKGTDGKWYYMVDGALDPSYNGLAKNENGIWYVSGGIVTTGKTGVIDTRAVTSANLESGKYYVVNGKMTGDQEGIFKDDAGAEYYVKKSAVVEGIKADESVIKVGDKMYCVNDEGKVAQPTCPLAASKDGDIWYIGKDGHVDLTKTGLIPLSTTEVTELKRIATNGGSEIYVSGGKFQDELTAVYANSKDGIYKYLKNGVVTTNDTSISKNTVVKGTDDNWYAVMSNTNGNAILRNGLAKKDDEVVLIDNYKVSTSATKVVKLDHTANAADIDAAGLASGPDYDVAIVDGKMAKGTRGFIENIKVETTPGTWTYETVYVVNGVCTKAGATVDLIKDTDKDTYWYVGTDGYIVDKTPGERIGKEVGGQLYYVRDGQVRKIDKTNFFYAGSLYNITDGSAAKVTLGATKVVKCSDGVTRAFDTTGTVITAVANQAKKVTDATTDYMVDENGEVIKLGGSKKYSIQNEATGDYYVFDGDGKVIKSADTYTSGVYAVTISSGTATASDTATASVTTDATGKITG